MWNFVVRFRITKVSVQNILQEIRHELEHATTRNHAISPMIQLLLSLRYYATGSFLMTVGDFSGVSKTSAFRIIHRVSAAIARLSRNIIKMPSTQQEITSAQIDFYSISHFPRIISALDCTHIKVQSFGGNQAELYRNRKGYFSLNVQCTCDAHLKFTNIVLRWPGSTHDSTIFNYSKLRARLENGEFGDGLVLADGGYALKPYLITPLPNLQTDAERLFNESQIRTRNPVERAFGVWKRRFPCLAIGMRFSKHRIIAIIVATAVLHNIALTNGEPLPPDDEALNIRWDIILNEEVHNQGPQDPDHGNTREILLHYFQSLL
ncbi:putative nuclease HARBI1 [Leptopilina boulardi]|uniref:putative nuclease HARBI1 n=1 Tax=Leptopilina boulardi TaxID=63433 RepID=UPI0021F57B91|nr:putative nuclease HARBI1 [Leptopilina boulardi]